MPNLRPNFETSALPDSDRKLISEDPYYVEPIRPDDPKFDKLRSKLRNAKRSTAST